MLLERAISCGQNLKSKNYMQSMKRFSMQSWTPILFFWVLGEGGGEIFAFVPMCSHYVPKDIPKSITCVLASVPPFTYKSAKRKKLHASK